MEQALVFASIVLGVAVAFGLGNLDRVLRSGQVRWHWAQPIFALFVLLTIISYWWMAARDTDGAISLGEFLPVMFRLVILVLLSAVSLPDKVGEDGVDLAQYYQDNRRYQWLLMALFMWSLHLGYLHYSWVNTYTTMDFIAAVWIDTIAGLVVISMMFARNWWLVAAGMLVLSIGPVLWIGRTLG